MLRWTIRPTWASPYGLCWERREDCLLHGHDRENSGDDIYAYNAYLSFTMYDLEGFSYDSLVPISTQPDLGSGEALPGKTIKGSISYALSAASEPDYVIFRRDIISETEAAWGAE